MFGELIDNIMTLLGIAILAFLVMAVLAPLDSLGWWAGWRKRESETGEAPRAESAVSQVPVADRYVVYLSGIWKASGHWSYPEETEFVAQLRAALPGAVVVDEVFPYSVTFHGLEEERFWNVIWGFVNVKLLRQPTA